jgi:hypothetical protein
MAGQLHLVIEMNWNRIPAALLIGGTLLVSGCAVHGRYYYDPYVRDRHRWDTREEQEYRRYLRERNERYRNFRRLDENRQREYWRWRHDHGDRH